MFLRAVIVFLVGLTPLFAEEPTFIFKRLVVADSDVAALAVPVDASSNQVVYTKNLPLFEAREFEALITPFVNQPLNQQLVGAMGTLVAKFAQTHDRMIVNVQLPTQSVADGTLRLGVVIGKFEDVTVRGNRWFSSRQIQERLGIKPGDEVRLSLLEEAVNWANTNPFRQVKVVVNPLQDHPGNASLIVGVKERIPWRIAGTADNYGNEVLGQWHYTGSVQAGNLWGRDHEASYHFVTGNDWSVYQAHIVSYRVPLPWRHFLEAGATYVRANPTFGVSNVFQQTAKNESASLRYRIPIKTGPDSVEVFAGAEFKRGNNNLQYAGTKVFASSNDTYQGLLGGTVIHRDKSGTWLFSGTFNFSPGTLTDRNSRTVYQQARVGSDPRYAYVNFVAQRSQTLPKSWELTTRLVGQFSSTNLLGSEQLTIGGPMSVRGFNTNILAGDEGYVLNAELYAPSIATPLKRKGKQFETLTTRLLAFYDAGQVFYHQGYGFDPRKRPMASAGLGMRMNIASNFSLTADYGWQLTDLPYPTTEHSQGHLKVVLAY